MALSVRMDPLLERELEAAAKRKGVTKSQFVIDAIERALGRKDPYALMLKLKAEEEAKYRGPPDNTETDYDPEKSREQLRRKLRAKHGVGGAG